MKKTLAIAAVLSAFTAGAFAQASAPMGSMSSDAASAPMKHSNKMKHSSNKMTHKKTDKGAMPAKAASGAM